jgi:hypothetical protein
MALPVAELGSVKVESSKPKHRKAPVAPTPETRAEDSAAPIDAEGSEAASGAGNIDPALARAMMLSYGSSKHAQRARKVAEMISGDGKLDESNPLLDEALRVTPGEMSHVNAMAEVKRLEILEKIRTRGGDLDAQETRLVSHFCMKNAQMIHTALIDMTTRVFPFCKLMKEVLAEFEELITPRKEDGTVDQQRAIDNLLQLMIYIVAYFSSVHERIKTKDVRIFDMEIPLMIRVRAKQKMEKMYENRAKFRVIINTIWQTFEKIVDMSIGTVTLVKMPKNVSQSIVGVAQDTSVDMRRSEDIDIQKIVANFKKKSGASGVQAAIQSMEDMNMHEYMSVAHNMLDVFDETGTASKKVKRKVERMKEEY